MRETMERQVREISDAAKIKEINEAKKKRARECEDDVAELLYKNDYSITEVIKALLCYTEEVMDDCTPNSLAERLRSVEHQALITALVTINTGGARRR